MKITDIMSEYDLSIFLLLIFSTIWFKKYSVIFKKKKIAIYVYFMTFIGCIAPLGGGEFYNFGMSELFAFAGKLVISDMHAREKVCFALVKL